MNASTQALAPISARSQRLINTEVFDAEYYAAESGKDFETKQAAARHFVQYGMKAGLSFHPLFDLGMFPAPVRDRYKAGDVEFLLSYLRSSESREHVWSWLFDPAGVKEPGAEGSLLLSRYRAGKIRDLPVPDKLPGSAPAWLDVRALMIAHAHASKAYELSKKPLRFTSWSETVERKWLQNVQNVPAATTGTATVVSIVMPAWNREVAIRGAIDSVRQQSLGSWELIVVDDGSTDGTRDVVRDYARLDSRIRLVEADHLGVCAARNRGIEEAAGEFLAFLDSDNTWRPDFLTNMCAGLNASGGKAAYSAIRMLNAREEFTGQPITTSQLLVRNYVDLNVLVVKTSFIRELGGFDNSLRRWVDYDLVLRIAETASIEYFPFIGCDYVDDHNEDRITRRESANWEFAVLGKNVLGRFVPDSVTDRLQAPSLSVVMRITESIDVAIRNIRRIQETIDADAIELIVLDEVQGFRTSLRLRAALAGLPGLKYIKLPRRYTEAIAYNIGSVHAAGSNLLFIKESVEVRAGTTEKLVEQLSDASVAAVQPLLTDPAGVVVSAGAGIHRNSLAIPLFRGLNIADARRHSGRGVDELAAAAFMVRTEAFELLGRFNAIFAGEAAVTDFVRRLSRAEAGEFVVVGAAVAVDHSADAFAEHPSLAAADVGWLSASKEPTTPMDAHYRDIGLDILAFVAPRNPRLQPAAPIVARRTSGSDPAASLRWAIKIGAEFSIGGDRWGDVPYAADLAAALTARGQEVVVDRVGALARPSNHLDDVVVVIRGLHRCDPQPGKTNILWAISRPDLIDREELLEFDVVFGASRIWCEYVRSEWGIEAQYLPQATNPSRFHPTAATEESPRYDLTFVGGPRKPIGRKIVADCVELGQNVSVWGPRWEQFIPANMVVADFIDNDELAAVYRSSAVVLNDHFEDMARWGFVNNRLYDAVASGARVISDDVDGIDEIFKGAVRTYTSTEQLAEILADPSGFPDDSEMAAISQMIRDEHNFDKRAETLLGVVREHRKSASDSARNDLTPAL
ncbi:glycosyltransferase [Arthrobacter sp. 2MCAF15]|uniref:glycosyltransferase n=1 Tax=Arthrobacter sp. 2MCAF15 TaxID=3232984 RepID=UPI003F8F8657